LLNAACHVQHFHSSKNILTHGLTDVSIEHIASIFRVNLAVLNLVHVNTVFSVKI
jgi:hypothetical protein